jgi:exopolysaccharide production protein ExoY
MTGVWQVTDRGEELLRDCTEMELTYLAEISLKKDLALILRTIPAMLRRAGI